jgi:hypothetical protein
MVHLSQNIIVIEGFSLPSLEKTKKVGKRMSKNNLINFKSFKPCKTKPQAVDPYDDVSKEMSVFKRLESQFLPEGKGFSDLTEEELSCLKNKYRFDYYKPGVYQGITSRGDIT